jgi:hypothetical protein
MGAAELAAELREAGLTVEEFDGWETRGISWEHGAPVAIMEHHTAKPVPFGLENLAGVHTGEIKCNANVKPDGTVWLIAFNACNFSSGPGVSQVLNEAIAGTPPTKSALDRKFVPGEGKVGQGDDDISGNRFCWNFENDHLGDGSEMPQVQHDAIVLASVVVANHFGLSWRNVIGHAEFTARKKDPFWNGDTRCIETVRNHMEVMMMFTAAEAASLKELAALPSDSLGKLAALSSAEISRLAKLAEDFSFEELNKLNNLAAFMITEGLTGEETARPALWYDALRNELGVPAARPDLLAQKVAAHVARPPDDPD